MNVVVTPSAAASISRRIRVMLVDDAVVVRGLFARWVEAEPDLEVVATLRTGRDAVNQLERVDPDVVVLDVDMPELDGIAALPLLLEKKRDLVVIMASTLTRRNAEISLRALSLGAADYIPKPGSNREVSASTAFRRDLIEKIRQLGQRAKRLRSVAPARAPKSAPSIVPQLEEIVAPPSMTLRPMPTTSPRVLLIGSSTGGPQALNLLVAEIGGVIQRAPVLITQHMPPTFTAVLAEHLARGRPSGELLQAGGGSDVYFRRRGLGQQGTGIGAYRHGRGWSRRRQKDCCGRRPRVRAGRGDQRRLGYAWSGYECRAVFCRSAVAGDRREAHAAVYRGAFVTPQDFDYLRKFLRDRSV